MLFLLVKMGEDFIMNRKLGLLNWKFIFEYNKNPPTHPKNVKNKSLACTEGNFGRLIKDKKGIMGEGLLMIYRLILISFIALIILGLSAVFYDYYLDVRDAEARIMAREVVDCLAPAGVVDLAELDKKKIDGNLISVCGFKSGRWERFYINAKIVVGGNVVREVEQGDSGVGWIYDLFQKGKSTDKIAKYEPGYFSEPGFKVHVLDAGVRQDGSINLEVFVNHEF